MAVKDESLHHATESLILPTPRKYYRANIHTSHWQLRSLISSPKHNLVYYPSGNDIIRLNTKTKDRELITTLSFSPRCLTAVKGWVCCGGDHGNYTAFPLNDDEEEDGGRPGSFLQDFTARLEADPDARLPLELDLPRRPIARETSIARRLRGFNNPIFSNIKKIGTEIVNCVTLWFPNVPGQLKNSTYKAPVAVVSNNDCTVCILDLQDSEILDKLTFPDFVNRAVMSPDGQLLIAICDDPFMYIHRRMPKSDPTNGRFESKDGVEYEWVLCGKIQLEGQRQADKSNMRGSFAASFSKSGTYLAVATQYGIISVFDTSFLIQEDADPLVALFTSSRPNSEAGAVRAMEFSPEPFDLLAWTEASGRVGIADVRSLFYSRQTLVLDSHADGVERVAVSDRPVEGLIDPRLRSFRTDPPSTSTTPDYLGLDFERRQRHLTREMLDRHQAPLASEEMEVLEAHQVARRQRDAARDSRDSRDARDVLAQAPSTSRWGPWAEGQRSTATSMGSTNIERNTADRSVSIAGLPSALREFVSNDTRSAASFRAFINERNQDRERRGQQQQPRRRGSVILAAAQTAIERETRDVGRPRSVTRSNDNDARTALRSRSVTRNTDNEPPTSLERLRLDAPRLQANGNESSSDPWGEIEALYSSRFRAEPPVDVTTRLRIEVEDEDRRDFAHRLRQPWRPLDEFSQTGPLRLGARYENSTILRGVLRTGSIFETMGCSWSQDGRILYVGADDGIHEYHVNVYGRKVFPSLALR